MSVNDVEMNCHSCGVKIKSDHKEISLVINEYWSLAKEYDEIKDAKKVRRKAEEYLYCEPKDLDRALNLMRLAVKILKACNGITN
jgi:transcription elongation factor Elf1